jgi:hypothetical protein
MGVGVDIPSSNLQRHIGAERQRGSPRQRAGEQFDNLHNRSL